MCDEGAAAREDPCFRYRLMGKVVNEWLREGENEGDRDRGGD